MSLCARLDEPTALVGDDVFCNAVPADAELADATAVDAESRGFLVVLGLKDEGLASVALPDGSERPVAGRPRHLDFVFALHVLGLSVERRRAGFALRRRGCYFVILVRRMYLPIVRLGTRGLRLVGGLRSSQVRYQYS